LAFLLSQMSEVTRILSAIEQGDPRAAEQLLPLVNEELRKLAAQKLASENPLMWAGTRASSSGKRPSVASPKALQSSLASGRVSRLGPVVPATTRANRPDTFDIQSAFSLLEVPKVAGATGPCGSC
jgi:hypothetical protein